MGKDFEGKSIIITGGGSGIGQAAALNLAARGARLTLVDVSADNLDATKSEILAACPGAEILLVTADVSKEQDVANYVQAACKAYGRIDGLFNNAGIEGKHVALEDVEEKDFDRVISINLKGIFFGLKHTLKVMRQQGGGYIVNTSSSAGIRCPANPVSPYVASKHGVSGLTKAAAIEYGGYGISVNAIAPGVTLTKLVIDSFKRAAGDAWEAAAEAYGNANPKKRCGTPEEIAELVAFLLSGRAGYLNGMVIPIDGAQSNVF